MIEENIIELDDHRASAEAAAKDLVPVLSEDAIALEFVRRNKSDVRFDWTTKKWHVWKGNRWRRDNTAVAFAWTRSLVRSMAKDQNAGDRRRLGTRKFAEGVEGFARTDQQIAVEREHWDRDIDVIGTPTGIVDLQTGEFFDPDPEQFITRATSVDPDMMIGCPRFLQFLNQVTGGDAQLKRLLQQWCGYCLCGQTREQKLMFVTGPGGTGKSTFIAMLLKMMGDYATSADMSTFTDGGFEQHPQQFARLAGMRLVTASETEEGRHWREARIKQLTGNDTVTAHFMRENDFTYTPQAKFTFVGNNTPSLRNVDSAIQRRMIIVPFLHKPDEPDPRLEAKLTEEMPGILSWMINGAVDWYNNGLIMPKAVVEATSRYLDEQNIFQQWLDECAQVDLENRYLVERNADLFASWSIFSKAHGEMPGTQAALNSKLRSAGFDPKQIKGLGTKGCHGIRLKATSWQSGGTE